MANKVDHAAQFLPFDALKGLREELQRREEKHSRIEKKEISEEQKETISNSLIKIDKGSVVHIVFYMGGHYIDIDGEITSFSKVYRYLLIGQSKIFYDDIYSIEILR